MDHIVTFPFLSLLWLDQSQIVAPHDQDLTICFAAHEPCARFTYRLYLRLCIYSEKKKKVFPQHSDLSSSCLIIPLHSVFAPLHLCTFALSHTSNTLCFIAPYQTSVSHYFALLDTTSGDHFTAPELHPSEPHRIYT